MIKRNETLLLFLLILLGFSLRFAGSVYFPMWAGPDEPAHFVYIQHIAEHGVPNFVLTKEIINDSLYYISVFEPPLYHALLSLFPLNLYFLRLFSVLFGTAGIFVTYLIAKRLGFNAGIRLASAAFVALLPTHVIVSSVVNNGSLVWLFCLITIYFSILALEERKAVHVALVGVFFSLAVLTKLTALSLVLTVAIVLGVYVFKSRGHVLKKLAVCLIPLAIVPVFLRNLATTGGLMPSMLSKPFNLSFSWLLYYITHLFSGVWLQEYGAATVPDYRILFFAFYAVVSLVALVGFVHFFFTKLSLRKRFMTFSVLILPVLLNFAGVTYLNTFCLCPDGRMLFDTIGLVAILFMVGLFGVRKKSKLVLFVLLTMFLLDLVVLVNYNAVLPEVIWSLL